MAAKVEIILQGTDNASKPIRDVNQALGEVGEKGKGSFGILQNAASSALGFIGAQAGMAFAGMVTSAVDAGAEYGAVMNRIQAVSGATAGEMDLINKQALRLGADLPISAADAAQGMYALVTAGYSAKDAIAASGGVAALAASQQMEVGRASEIVSAALRGFGLEASEAGRVTDLLSQTASRSAVEVEDVGNTLKYVGPVAGALKQPMEDVTAAIGLMGNAGVKGEMAGTALRSMLANLAAPTDAASATLNQLGIQVTNTDGTMRPLTDIMGQFRDKTAGMTDTQKANVAQTIAGKEAMSGFLAIVGASQTDFDGMTSAMQNSQGATDRFAQSMNKGLKFEIEQLKGSIETVLIQGFQAVEPVMVSVVSAITPLVNQIGEALPGAMAFAQTAWDTVLQPAFAAVGSFLEETVFPALGTAVTWFQDNIPTAMGGVESAWTGTLQPALQAVWDFLDGTIFPVLGALVTWYASTIPVAMDAVQTAWNEVLRPVFQAVWDVLDSTLFPILGTLARWFVESIPGAIEGVQTAWNEVLKPALQALGDFIQDPVVPILTTLAGWFDENLPTAIAAIETAWNTVLKPALDALWAFILDPILPILSTLATAVGATLETAFGVAKAAWDNVLHPILSALWAFILDPVVPILATLASAVGAGLETAFGLAKAAWDNVLKPALDGIVTFVRDTLVPGITTIQTKWGEIWDNVKSKLTTLVPDIIASVTGLINDIKTKFTETDWGAVGKAVIDGIGAGIRNGAESITSAARNAAQAALDAAKGALGISSPSKVMEEQVGVPIVEGIISGMQESTASLITATEAVTSAAVTSLATAAPSAAQAGQSVTTALASGLRDGEPTVVAEAKRLVAQMVSIMADLAAPLVEGEGQFENWTQVSVTTLANISWRIVEFLRNSNQALAEIGQLGVINKEQRRVMVEVMKGLADFMVDTAKSIHRLIWDTENDLAPALTELNKLFKTTVDLIGGTIGLVTVLLDKVGGTRFETILNNAATRQWIINLAQAMVQWGSDIGSAVDDITVTVNADALPNLKRLADILSPIKSAIDGTVGMVTTLLDKVANQDIEDVFNNGPARQYIINLAQAMVDWANAIASAVDDVQVTVDEAAIPGLKRLADILSPIKSSLDHALGIVKLMGSGWVIPGDIATRAQKLTQAAVDVGKAALTVANAFDGQIGAGATTASQALPLVTKMFKDAVALLKAVTDGSSVSGDGAARTLSALQTLLTALADAASSGGLTAGESWGDAFKRGVVTTLAGWTPFAGGESAGNRGTGSGDQSLGNRGTGIGSLALGNRGSGTGGATLEGLASGAGQGAAVVNFNYYTYNTENKTTNVSMSNSTAEASRAGVMSIYGLVMYS